MFIKNNTLIKRLLLICFLMAWAICLKNNSIFKSIEKTDDTSGFTITYRKAKPKKPISDIKSEEVKGLITKISEELPTTQPKTQILSERKNFKKIEDNQIILGKNVAECQTSNKKITEIEKLEEELNFVQALSHAVEDLQSMETLLYERLWNTDETQDKTQDQTKQFYKNLEVERELIAEIEGNFEESYSTMTTQVKEENLKKIEKIINLLMENNEKIKKSSNNIKTIILKQIEDMNYFINELEIIQIIIITS